MCLNQSSDQAVLDIDIKLDLADEVVPIGLSVVEADTKAVEQDLIDIGGACRSRQHFVATDPTTDELTVVVHAAVALDIGVEDSVSVIREETNNQIVKIETGVRPALHHHRAEQRVVGQEILNGNFIGRVDRAVEVESRVNDVLEQVGSVGLVSTDRGLVKAG